MRLLLIFSALLLMIANQATAASMMTPEVQEVEYATDHQTALVEIVNPSKSASVAWASIKFECQNEKDEEVLRQWVITKGEYKTEVDAWAQQKGFISAVEIEGDWGPGVVQTLALPLQIGLTESIICDKASIIGAKYEDSKPAATTPESIPAPAKK